MKIQKPETPKERRIWRDGDGVTELVMRYLEIIFRNVMGFLCTFLCQSGGSRKDREANKPTNTITQTTQLKQKVMRNKNIGNGHTEAKNLFLLAEMKRLEIEHRSKGHIDGAW